MTTDALAFAPDPMLAPAMRWGILGAGGIAAKFALAVRDLTASQVVAVASASSLAKAKAFADEYNAGDAYQSYEELVARDDIDAVYVATTHNNHHEPAILAINAGKHVLVEKAFAQNGAQVEAILEAAAAAGVFVMEAMWTRHLPHMHLMRDLIAQGELGEVVTVIADHGQKLTHVTRLMDPSLAGGALLDLGVYPIAFAHDVLGAPASVSARGHMTSTGVDGQVSLTLDYNGAMAALHTTLFAASGNTARIVGTEGRLEFEGNFYTPTVVRLVKGDDVVAEYDARVDNGFQFQAAEVARCVATGVTESPLMTWQDSREVMAIMDEVRSQIGLVYPNEVR